MKAPCIRTRFLLGLFLTVAAPRLLAAVQLANASFEEPGGEGRLWISDRAVGWERWGAWFNRETDWTPVYDGQCITAYHHWKITGDDTSGLYQDLPDVPAGKPCTFSIRALRDKGTNAQFVELRIEPFQGGEPLASQAYTMTDLKSGKWQELAVTAVPRKQGLRVLVIVKPGRSSHRNGALKFDNAALKLVDPQAQGMSYATPRPARR